MPGSEGASPAASGGGGVETIVASCTAAGAGERAVLRLSGPRAWDVARSLLTRAEAFVPGRDAAGVLHLGPGAPVPVTCLVWRAPRSLTGEDVCELHLPGWPALVTEVLRRAVEAGARPAGRGEFLRRALLAGRFTLAQILALSRLTGAVSGDEARAALRDLTSPGARPTSPRKARLREALLAALVLVEAHVDFEEEDTEAVDAAALRTALEIAARAAEESARGASLAAPRDGATDVVLLGPPNAGKSTLFAALCPAARVRIAPEPGTTRDVLHGRAEWEGRVWRVWDGPGLQLEARDALDRRAMERHLAGVPAEAVVLLVAEAASPGAPSRAEDESVLAVCARAAAGRVLLRVESQIDRHPGRVPGLVAEAEVAEIAQEEGDAPPRIAVSAHSGAGLDALRSAILRAAPVPGAPDLATLEELLAARQVLPLLEEARALPLPEALPLLSLLLREALQRLEADPDATSDLDEELLDRIFAGFCVGK